MRRGETPQNNKGNSKHNPTNINLSLPACVICPRSRHCGGHVEIGGLGVAPGCADHCSHPRPRASIPAQQHPSRRGAGEGEQAQEPLKHEGKLRDSHPAGKRGTQALRVLPRPIGHWPQAETPPNEGRRSPRFLIIRTSFLLISASSNWFSVRCSQMTDQTFVTS